MQRFFLQAQAHVTVKGASDKAELADKEQTILELRETNEVIKTPQLPAISTLTACAASVISHNCTAVLG